MKHFFLRSSVALACVFGLASCGGDDRGEIAVRVNISGVNTSGLTLKLNDNPEHQVSNSGTYFFPELLPVDGSYTVTHKGRPDNVAQDCVLANGTGKVSTIGPSDITLTCIISTYDLGGTISGLKGELILVNGSIQRTFTGNSAGTAFNFTMTKTEADGTFTGKVAQGAPYGVLVFKQPTGQNCQFAQKADNSGSTGNGTMPAGPVSTIQITCA